MPIHSNIKISPANTLQTPNTQKTQSYQYGSPYHNMIRVYHMCLTELRTNQHRVYKKPQPPEPNSNTLERLDYHGIIR